MYAYIYVMQAYLHADDASIGRTLWCVFEEP